MRIRVVKKSGEQEILTIVPPLHVPPNPVDCTMEHFTDASGTDFYFNKDDGTYDGWGRGVSLDSPEEASEVIKSVEENREPVDPILP